MGRTLSRRTVAFATAVALLVALAVAMTGPGAEAAQGDYHVVVFKDPPAVLAAAEPGQRFDPKSERTEAHVAHLKGVHGDYARWLQRRAPEAEIVRELFLASNAVAVKLNGADPALLSRGPGAKYSTPSTLYRPSMNASVEIINADAVWPFFTGGRADAGAGIDVGVIDTGIYFSHPFFGCDDKHGDHGGVYYSGVTGVADDIRGGGTEIVFDHGTHVAGTIGGCYLEDVEISTGVTVPEISGVAPGVTLHDYNVFPGYGAGFVAFGGSAFSHDIAAAVDDALADGMDVINMSLGGGVQGPHDFLAEAVENVAGHMVVAVAAGNSGDAPGTIESPGSAPSVITVGASTNSHVLALDVEVDYADEEATDDNFNGAVGDFGNFDNDSGDYSGDTSITAANIVPWEDVSGGDKLACTSIGTDKFAENEIALISRGTCTFSTKIANAEAAGAAAVIVYNNVPGEPFGMGASPSPPTSIPATMISMSDGDDLLAALKTVTATATIEGPEELRTADKDVLASFSSRGPTPFTYTAKPDLVAPGVNIISSVVTWHPPTQGDPDGSHTTGWAPFQGTSMATPHVAGAAALLLAEDPRMSPADVKSALVNHTADVVLEWVLDQDEEWVLEPPGVLGRGSGRLDVEASFAATSFAAPSSVSFGRVTGNKPVSIERTVMLSAETCDLASVSGDHIIAHLDGSTLTATFDASRSVGSGNYQGEIMVDCNGSILRIPWFALVDRRASG